MNLNCNILIHLIIKFGMQVHFFIKKIMKNNTHNKY
jgi:hypothetical protein